MEVNRTGAVSRPAEPYITAWVGDLFELSSHTASGDQQNCEAVGILCEKPARLTIG